MSAQARRFSCTSVVVAACLAACLPVAAQKDDTKSGDDPNRPKLALKANPNVGIAPSRVTLTAELVGGANDYEDLYCASAEWDWGDGTRSESSNDCEPYRPGKSEIKRRFITQHVFRVGDFHVTFRLKRREKVVASGTTDIRVQPGFGDTSDIDRRPGRPRFPSDPS
jgi:hypothetical protein